MRPLVRATASASVALRVAAFSEFSTRPWRLHVPPPRDVLRRGNGAPGEYRVAESLAKGHDAAAALKPGSLVSDVESPKRRYVLVRTGERLRARVGAAESAAAAFEAALVDRSKTIRPCPPRASGRALEWEPRGGVPAAAAGAYAEAARREQRQGKTDAELEDCGARSQPMRRATSPHSAARGCPRSGVGGPAGGRGPRRAHACALAGANPETRQRSSIRAPAASALTGQERPGRWPRRRGGGDRQGSMRPSKGRRTGPRRAAADAER